MINLSGGDSSFIEELHKHRAISRLVDKIFEHSVEDDDPLGSLTSGLDGGETIRLYSMLLSNLTREEKGIKILLQVGEPLFGFNLTQLFNLFSKHASDDVIKGRLSTKKDDKYAFIGQILTNSTSVNFLHNFFPSQCIDYISS